MSKRHTIKRIRRQPAGRNKKRGGGKRRDRWLWQITVAGVIFVLLTLLRLLQPDGIAALAAELSLEQDADFRAAFSAVGEAIAGERAVGESLEEAYEAVFAPAEYRAAKTAAVFAAGQEMALPASRLAREMAGKTAEADIVTQTEQQIMAEQVLISFSAAAPENVSFAQAALGFDYTTPAQGTMTSAFGYREHPVYGGERFHYGLDIAAARGTEIRAFAAGTVKATGESSSLGKYLMLSHPGGFTTLYAHCDKVAAKAGKAVKLGEKIAEMGSSGVATGTHLHFELLQGNTYLNPIYYVEVN